VVKKLLNSLLNQLLTDQFIVGNVGVKRELKGSRNRNEAPTEKVGVVFKKMPEIFKNFVIIKMHLFGIYKNNPYNSLVDLNIIGNN